MEKAAAAPALPNKVKVNNNQSASEKYFIYVYINTNVKKKERKVGNRKYVNTKQNLY